MLSDDRPSYERIARQVFVLSFALFLHQLQNLANSGCPLEISPWAACGPKAGQHGCKSFTIWKKWV